jgi:MerR family copper efflux transcriptional regulator
MVKENSMRIKDLCAATGLSRDTLRFYERKGLLNRIGRSANGYREYGDEAVVILAFVKHCQGLGFRLRDIAEHMDGIVSGRSSFTDLKPMVEAKIRETEKRIVSLRGNLKELQKVMKNCKGPLKIKELRRDVSSSPRRGTNPRRRRAGFHDL